MSAVRQCLRLGKTGVRQFTTNKIARSAETEATESFKKLISNQERFQKNDLIDDVYKKGGALDVLLYRFVFLGSCVGVALGAKDLYTLAFL